MIKIIKKLANFINEASPSVKGPVFLFQRKDSRLAGAAALFSPLIPALGKARYSEARNKRESEKLIKNLLFGRKPKKIKNQFPLYGMLIGIIYAFLYLLKNWGIITFLPYLNSNFKLSIPYIYAFLILSGLLGAFIGKLLELTLSKSKRSKFFW